MRPWGFSSTRIIPAFGLQIIRVFYKPFVKLGSSSGHELGDDADGLRVSARTNPMKCDSKALAMIWAAMIFAGLVVLCAQCAGQCGGLIDDGHPVEMTAGNRVPYFLHPGITAGRTQQETQTLIDQAMAEFRVVSQLDFYRVTQSKSGRIRIDFQDNATMKRLGRKSTTPGGLAWSSGRIAINRDRGMSDRALQVLVQHEVGHALMRWNHTNDEHCVMNPDISAKGFCPNEARRLQSRYGKVPAFHPPDRMFWGREVREWTARFNTATANWKHNRERRDYYASVRDWEKMTQFNRPTKTYLDQIRRWIPEVRRVNQEWHESNKRWTGNTGAVQIKRGE